MHICLIAHDIRSCHNIGSLARSADGLGVTQIWCTGVTPYISADNDPRPPHLRIKSAKDIHKTALGAEETVQITGNIDIKALITKLKGQGFLLFAIEQSENTIPLKDYPPGEKIALLLGNEVHGISKELLGQCDSILEIPMLGKKESYNVSVAGALALYELKRAELY